MRTLCIIIESDRQLQFNSHAYLAVKEDSVGNKVKMIVPTTDTLVTRLQQMLVLVDHAEAKVAIHCYDELGERHILLSNNSYYQLSGAAVVAEFAEVYSLPGAKV